MKLRITVEISACILLFWGCGQQESAQNNKSSKQSQSIPKPELVDTSAPTTDENAELPNGDGSFGSFASDRETAAVRRPVEKIYRPDDDRVQPDADRLRELGINKYESRHLVLFTDIDPEIAKTLPPLIDYAYAELEEYFGPLPPARSGEDFQMTGYLIKDRDLFFANGLVPFDLPRFSHGQHRGQEFWMYEQEYDFYRRHLLVHEATHCYMMIMPGLHPAIWYLEGMAEMFGVHQFTGVADASQNDQVRFTVWPDRPDDFIGFSRIEMLQAEVAAGRMLNLDQAADLGVAEFANAEPVPYAWGWALCSFLDAHPRYQARFRQLGEHLTGREFFRLAETLFQPDKTLLAAEWDQFVRRIDYSWDFERNAFQMRDGPLQPLAGTKELAVSAEFGWQSSGFRVEPGVPYTITARGTVTLANTTKPWISEPQGISVRYANGKPIGRLEVAVLVDVSEGELIDTPFDVHDCGQGDVIRFEHAGELMFSVNDFSGERDDNRGGYQVTVLPPG